MGVDGRIWMVSSVSFVLQREWKLPCLSNEVETQSFKVSLRSNGNVDVSKIAVYFGGGGHMRAAGCDLQGSVYDVINNVTEQICKQFQEQEV
mgnify:CR=1 FL=1